MTGLEDERLFSEAVVREVGGNCTYRLPAEMKVLTMLSLKRESRNV